MSYQPLFDKLDATVVALEERHLDELDADAADVLKRLGFVVVNLLNTSLQVFPNLVLPVEGEPEGAATPSEDADEEPTDPDPDLPVTS